MGAPAIYAPECRDIICDRLAAGEPLRQICMADGMPSESLVRKWATEDAAFGALYARARNIGLDCIAEGTMEIADDLTEDPASRRVRIDTRKWLLSKMRPDKYGDHQKIEMDVTSGGQSWAEILRARRAKRGVVDVQPAIEGTHD